MINFKKSILLINKPELEDLVFDGLFSKGNSMTSDPQPVA